MLNRSRLNHEIDQAKVDAGGLLDEIEETKWSDLPKFVYDNGNILMNEINIDFLGNGQTLKNFKFSNDKINAVLGLKDYQRKYLIDLLLKKQKGGEVIIDN